VLTLGATAALDPFLLAKHVQASKGALRLTPDMKLVAQVGKRPERAPGGDGARPGARGSKRAETVARVRAAVAKAVPAAAGPGAASPALEAAAGRELLAAARDVLAGLVRCARPDEAPPPPRAPSGAPARP
jgi:transcription-repair coupling factor (superfamily II helicase)